MKVCGDIKLIWGPTTKARTNPISFNKICSNKVKLEWTAVEQKAFTEINKIIGRYMLHPYPKFIDICIINVDAIKLQLGILISSK